MYQNTKSATVAGLLGIFLGAFGAHNWYLGEKNKGIIHVCMMSGGVLIEIIAIMVLPNVLSLTMLIRMAWLFTILASIAWLSMAASAVWGLVEGIIILVQGDAGLAQKGYAVAQPVFPMQGYGQPMNNGMGGMNNMNNMNNMGGMNGNMNNMGWNNGMNNMNNIGGMNGNMNNGTNMSDNDNSGNINMSDSNSATEKKEDNTNGNGNGQ